MDQGGYHFIFQVMKSIRQMVGILLWPEVKQALQAYNVISERIKTARLISKFRKIFNVQCYAPSESDDDETKDQFYSQLDSVTRSLPKGDIKLVMGDFNAKSTLQITICNNLDCYTEMIGECQ
ncbi:uncharacterized protein LOC131994704 [Stomoxys calcitrans]|uniref:uncharacterized protein LOC131994704 n=1 Tax=Stomoxys calcitrans TaxID=35570 RepID=UPI0027E21893|nr:uncharacterized protein LOC131994704 [Stomoxys calcitrans]